MGLTTREKSVKPSSSSSSTDVPAPTAEIAAPNTHPGQQRKPYLPFHVLSVTHLLTACLFMWCFTWTALCVLLDSAQIYISLTNNIVIFTVFTSAMILPLVYYGMTVDYSKYALHETSTTISGVARVLGVCLALLVFRLIFFSDIATPHIAVTVHDLHQGV